MRKLAVYVHGKGGNATESEHYKPLLPEYDVIGFDYKSETPWDAKQEFTNLFDNYCKNYDYIVATVYKGNIIKNLIMDCQSYTKYRPNETTGGIFVSWRRKEELPTGA